jgi:hypothetical protein
MIKRELYDKLKEMRDKITVLEHDNYTMRFLLSKFLFEYYPPVYTEISGVKYARLTVRVDLYFEWKKIYDSIISRSNYFLKEEA